jgi:hypothetical protein
MKTFTDSAGRSWSVALNVAAVKRVKGLLGVDLLDLLKPETEGGVPLMTRLAQDVVLRVDVIFAIVRPQAEHAGVGGVTDEQFGEALGGEAILAASEAFFEELTGFFRGMGRTELASALLKQQTVLSRAGELMQSRIDAIDLESLAGGVTLGTPSASSPASSASIPIPSPSAS